MKTKEKRQEVKIGWMTLFGNKEVAFALMSCFLGTFNIVFWSAWISTDLGALGFPVDDVGYVIGSQSVVYLIGCLLLPYTCESSPRRLQFTVASFGFGVSMLFFGPSIMLDFPDIYWLIVFAFPLMGLFQVFVFIPIIPEMLERLQVEL